MMKAVSSEAEHLIVQFDMQDFSDITNLFSIISCDATLRLDWSITDTGEGIQLTREKCDALTERWLTMLKDDKVTPFFVGAR